MVWSDSAGGKGVYWLEASPRRDRGARTSRHRLPAGDEVTIVLDQDLGAVARVRSFVVAHLARRGMDELADDAQLIASELVTNALLHVGPPAEVVLRVSPPRARLEVRDRSRVPPVRSRRDIDVMTGRGLHLVEGLAHDWGVALLPTGKAVWAELEAGREYAAQAERDEHALIEMWAAEMPDPGAAPAEEVFRVRLGDVPTDLLLAAKSHVDNLVREFTLAASGADSGASAQLPPHIARMVEGVVNRFSDARQSIKRQALAAANAGRSHVALELTLPPSAADAGEEYLRALDQADAYCRAARLLTLESPPQHRVFRRWYVEELIGQLRRAAVGEPAGTTRTFEQRLLDEIGTVTAAQRRADRAARLHALVVALAAAETPGTVADAVLGEGVPALGAGGGAILLAGEPTLVLAGALGHDPDVVALLGAQPHDADLPTAAALRTGEAVWLESRAERDRRFPALAALEPGSVALCAVPLQFGERRLGVLRLSFPQTRVFDAAERAFVEAMAAQAAQALERARLARAHDDLGRRLRRGLLPRRLPEIPGVALAAVHRPLAPSIEIGAAFYDVWPCAPGRWGLALGDACGTGPEAAAAIAMVRHTLRALAATETDAGAIVRRLGRALADALADAFADAPGATDTPGDAAAEPGDAAADRSAAVVFGLLTAEPGRCRLDLASGGHPGAVVVRAGGRAEVAHLEGSRLGADAGPVVDRRDLRLAAGDEVVLVSGAATAARGEGAASGIARIAGVVAAARAEGAQTAAAVEQAVLARAGGSLDDDLAILTLRAT